MKLIIQNPFRVIGLPVTASDREIAKRISDLSVFIDMGKTQEFDCDNYFSAKPIRTSDTIREAAQYIEQPNNKLFYALFWFWENSSDTVDEMAFEELKKGNIDKAIQFWEKATNKGITAQNISNFKNLSIMYLGLAFKNGNLEKADLIKSLGLFGEFIYSDHFEDFTNLVLGNKYSFNQLESIRLYVDEIILLLSPHIDKKNGIKTKEIIEYFAIFDLKIEYNILDKFTIQYIHEINSAIDEYDKKVYKDESNAGEYGLNLASAVQNEIKSLKEIFSGEVIHFQPILDKLAEKLISAAVSAWNGNDVYKNDTVHLQIKSLENEIRSVAVGKAVIDRFEEQFRILDDYLDSKEKIAVLIPLAEELNRVTQKCQSVETREKYHIVKQFVFDNKENLDEARRRLSASDIDEEEFENISNLFSNYALFVQDCAVLLANELYQYGRAIELVDMARRILLYEYNNELYDINKDLSAGFEAGRKLLGKNISSSDGLLSRVVGVGIRSIKGSKLCGCGSGKGLKECCSV